MSDKAKRYNKGKPMYSLLHLKSLEPVVRVLEYGLDKYGERDNWMKEMPLTEIEDSLTRHLVAINAGETHDDESGELHMAHLACNAIFWMYQYKQKEM